MDHLPKEVLFLAESFLGNSQLRASETLTSTLFIRKVLQPAPQSSEFPFLDSAWQRGQPPGN